MTRHKNLLAAVAFYAVAQLGVLPVHADTPDLSLPLPVTNFVHNGSGFAISWADYTDIAGWQLYYRESLTAGDGPLSPKARTSPATAPRTLRASPPAATRQCSRSTRRS